MARPDVDLVDRALVAEIDADRLHEAHRPADLVRDHLVAATLERARDELLVPRVHLREVGEAALRERAQEVERRDGLVVRLHETLGIRRPRLGGRLLRVDSVTAERRELDPVDDLRVGGARLCELACDAPHLHDGKRRAVREHRRHLQQHLQALADRDRRDVLERLGAIARLEDERAALGGLAERGAQCPRLTGEDERRQLAEPGPHGLERGRIGPLRLLERRSGLHEPGVQTDSVAAMAQV